LIVGKRVSSEMPALRTTGSINDRLSCGYFEAQRVGILLSEISSYGKVASLYDEAVNILLENGLFVSLVRTSDSMTALSVEVPALFSVIQAGSCLRSACLERGTEAQLRESGLVLEGLIIGFRNAALWPGIICSEDIEGFSLNSIQLLEEALLARGKEGGLLSILSPVVTESVHTGRAEEVLGNVSLRSDPQSLTGLCEFVGLGPGFTPSGDDFLCGVLLGERLLLEKGRPKEKQSKSEQGLTICRVKKHEIEARLNGTTSGGRTLLWQALQGHFPYYLIQATRAMSAATTISGMCNVVARAAAHGETSGTDTLVGLLWYLKYIFAKITNNRSLAI
jgi:hypothetical protein